MARKPGRNHCCQKSGVPVVGINPLDESLMPFVRQSLLHDVVMHAMSGQISLEHEIGRLKVDDLERCRDPAKPSGKIKSTAYAPEKVCPQSRSLRQKPFANPR
jgi:hypothetical protein